MESGKYPIRNFIKVDEVELLLKGRGLSQMLIRQLCKKCKFSLAILSYASRPMMTIREEKDCEGCGHMEEIYHYLH